MNLRAASSATKTSLGTAGGSTVSPDGRPWRPAARRAYVGAGDVRRVVRAEPHDHVRDLVGRAL